MPDSPLELALPIQLEAAEYIGTCSSTTGGTSCPTLIEATDADDKRYKLYLKLKEPSCGSHFGPTSLACELICCILARSLGMKVPDYSVVAVSREFCQLLPEDTRDTYEKNIGLNFGSVALDNYAELRKEFKIHSTSIVKQLEHILSFDATILNFDRRAVNTNLLYCGDELAMMDHSLAIAVYSPSYREQLKPYYYPPEAVTAHCAFNHVKNKGLGYDEVLGSWSTSISIEHLRRIRSMIPRDWETTPGDLDTIFEFLQERPNVFPEIISRIKAVTL